MSNTALPAGDLHDGSDGKCDLLPPDVRRRSAPPEGKTRNLGLRPGVGRAHYLLLKGGRRGKAAASHPAAEPERKVFIKPVAQCASA
jgi:hypothetical protein